MWWSLIFFLCTDTAKKESANNHGEKVRVLHCKWEVIGWDFGWRCASGDAMGEDWSAGRNDL
jgi:hypothetical protein